MAASGPTPSASIMKRVWKTFSRDSLRTNASLSPGPPRSHPAEQADHFEGGLGRLGSLVPRLRAGAFDRLLHGVRGEHAERYGDPRLQPHLGDSLAALGAH